jgi:hypothetical protein
LRNFARYGSAAEVNMQRLLLALSVACAAGCSNDLKVQEAEPEHGAYTGGEEVLIKGSGFQPGRGGVRVMFGKREAGSVAIESSTKIKVLSPSGDKNTTVDISVIFDDGKAFMLKNGFKYIDNTQRGTFDKAFDVLGKKPGEPGTAPAPAPVPAPAANAPAPAANAPAPAANAPAPAANAPAPAPTPAPEKK